MTPLTQDTLYWLALSFTLTPMQLRKLATAFASGEEAWRATREQLRALNFERNTIERVLTYCATTNPEEQQACLLRENIHFVVRGEADYPTLLNEIPDAPHVLFYRGQLPLDPTVERPVAVVGTRTVSDYGAAVALNLTRELARGGLTIVSGLARGVDAIVHRATLEVGGRTIAVLGSSVTERDIYPPEHRHLAKEIETNNGLIISEYPPGVGPNQHHFPERNRIIAGLSLGTLVVEAPEKSGALITARLALDYNREVLAVPGRITDSTSTGANSLIAAGAHVVTSAMDVFTALGLTARSSTNQVTQLNEMEKKLLAALSQNPTYIDALADTCEADLQAIAAALTSLELAGVIRDIGGKRYIRLS